MSTSKDPNEIKINPNQGGKAAIERLVEAYGFKTRQALADHFEVSKSTLANRYLRDTFPSDWISQCALESGVSLRCLANADGPVFLDARSQVITLPKAKIKDERLSEDGFLIFDLSLLSKDLNKILAIESDKIIYLIRREMNDINDGLWVIAIDDMFSVHELVRLQNNKVIFETNSKKIECNIDDINIIAKAIMNCI